MSPIDRWWQTRAPRERVALLVLAAFLTAVAGYLVLAPLAGDAARTRLRLELEQARLGRLTAQAREIAALAEQLRPRLPTRLDERVMAGLAPIPLAEPPLIERTGSDGVRVRSTAISFDALIAALEPVLRDTGAHVTELSATAVAGPGMVRIDLTLGR